MASSGKQYTMTFLLKAAADNSFQAAFGKAKQQLNDFQNVIKQNNSTLNDISGYQRQMSSVTALVQKTAEKQSAYEAAKAAAQAAGGADEQLNAQEAKLKTAFEASNVKLQQQVQKLNEQKAALEAAGVDTGNLAQEQQRLAQETENAKQQQEAMAEEQNRLIDQMAELSAVSAEAYTVVQVMEKLATAINACVDAAAGFEYAMSATEAVSQATASEMSELTAVAKEVGATTKFTATETAQAMEYMGLAGWSAQEMIEGIPAVADLAAASGEDLSRVCDIVTDSMMALGYTTEDTSRFCDVLAQTSRTTNTNVSMMGDTLKYVASTAGALDYSIEDVATAMGALASSGIKSSMAGTALRNILASLADPSDEAAQALEELGISLADSEGNVYSLNNVVAQLRQGFAGLTQEQKVQYASMIAGKRGMTGVLTLVNMSQQAYDELGTTIRDCDGAAESMADTRLDNFQGSVVLLQSAFDALKTSVGEALTGGLKQGADTLTQMVNGANEFVKSNQTLVIGATAAATAFGAMAVGVTTATAAIKIFNAVSEGTLLRNPTLWGAAAIVAGIAGIATAIVSLDKDVESASSALKRLRDDLQTLETNQSNIEQYYELSEAMNDSSLSADELVQVQTELDETVQALKKAYPELLGDLEAGTEAWNLQTEAILANIEAQKAADLKEAADNMDGYARRLKVAAENYQEASADAEKALEGMRSAGDVDFSQTIQNVQAMADALSRDIQTGKVEVDFDDTSEYMTRIKTMQDAFQGISGEQIEFDTLADVAEQLERYKDGADSAADVTTAFKQQYSDAMAEMARNKKTLDEGKQLFLEMADAGFMLATELEESGLSISDVGITMEDIGQRVREGVMTGAEAMEIFGLTTEELGNAIRVYDTAVGTAARSTGALAQAEESVNQATIGSYEEFTNVVEAVAAVNSEMLTAEQAAGAYGLSIDDMNEYLSVAEQREKNAADACAVVEAGYMTAEEAADAFGTTVSEMELYTAQERLNNLQEELQELQEAYDEAYQSAYDSIMGQISLTEALGSQDVETASIQEAQKSLRDTLAYLQDYKQAISDLQNYGFSSDFLLQFADGTQEGMAQAISMAKELNGMSFEDAQREAGETQTLFEEVQGVSDDTASALADMETNYTETKDNIIETMETLAQETAGKMGELVAELNQSAGAGAAGTATGVAYKVALESQLNQALSIARSKASQISSALNSAGSVSVTGGKAAGGFTHGPELAGEDPRYPVEAVISFNPQYREENIRYLEQAARMLGVSGANGAGIAADGSAYQVTGVTDFGAALIDKAARVQYEGGGTEGYNLSVNFQPQIHIDGSSGTESIREQIMACADDLIELVEETIDNREKYERRTRFGR